MVVFTLLWAVEFYYPVTFELTALTKGIEALFLNTKERLHCTRYWFVILSMFPLSLHVELGDFLQHIEEKVVSRRWGKFCAGKIHHTGTTWIGWHIHWENPNSRRASKMQLAQTECPHGSTFGTRCRENDCWQSGHSMLIMMIDNIMMNNYRLKK